MRGPAGAVLGAALALAAGCKSKFTGPYMCATGYDSCVNPGQNACETDTTTDGLNCGGCGTVCPVGGPCLASACGAAAVQIAQTGSSALVRTNASAVFWSASDVAATIYSLPLSAGAGATPTAVIRDGAGLGSVGHTPFAVDDTNLYYLSLVNGPTTSCPNGGCVNVVQAPMGGASTVLVPWASLSALLTEGGIPVGNGGNTGNFGVSLTVGGSDVYFLFTVQSNNVSTYVLGTAKVGVAGQNGTLLAKTNTTNGPNSSELAANSTSAVFETWENGNPFLQVVRAADKQMTTLRGNSGPYGGGVGPLAVDASNVYTISSGCPCNNDNQPYNGPPPGAVTRIPLDGSPTQSLASFWGSSSAVTIDSTNVYWSTDTAAWKVPFAGGTPTPVAGNLSNGMAAYQCSGGCNNGSPMPGARSIAVASSGLYIAVTGTNQAILRVAR